MKNLLNLCIGKKINSIHVICLFLICSMGIACQHSAVEVLEYTQKHESDLQKQANGKALNTYITFLPGDLVAWRDQQLSGDTTAFEILKKEYQNVAAFELHILDKEGGKGINKKIQNDDNHEFINNYYNYQLHKDIHLVILSDTLPCTYFHAIQQGGINDELLFSCGFDLNISKIDGPFSLILYDRMFGLDTLTYHFSSNDLRSIPAITK